MERSLELLCDIRAACRHKKPDLDSHSTTRPRELLGITQIHSTCHQQQRPRLFGNASRNWFKVNTFEFLFCFFFFLICFVLCILLLILRFCLFNVCCFCGLYFSWICSLYFVFLFLCLVLWNVRFKCDNNGFCLFLLLLQISQGQIGAWREGHEESRCRETQTWGIPKTFEESSRTEERNLETEIFCRKQI